MDWTVRGSNTGGDEVFRTRPDWTGGPFSLLYNGYRGMALTTQPSRAKVKERVELYLVPLWVFMACSRVTFFFTDSFNIESSVFFHTLYLCEILKIISYFPLCSIHRFVLIMEAHCVLCEIQIKLWSPAQV
jgi:hypothetical protein